MANLSEFILRAKANVVIEVKEASTNVKINDSNYAGIILGITTLIDEMIKDNNLSIEDIMAKILTIHAQVSQNDVIIRG